MIRISEIFHSIQGEGQLTGVPSVFIRTSGCNLRCWFCDTPYASWKPEGDSFSVSEVIEKTLSYACDHVVITGGEPMIVPELPELCSELRKLGKHITIETAGTVIQEPTLSFDLLLCDLMSISPKLSNSAPAESEANNWHERHNETRDKPEVVAKLIALSKDFQLKFVVGSILDAEEVMEFIAEYAARGLRVPFSKILMMPRGVSTGEIDQQAEWLVPWCKAKGVRYCDRTHIRWFGNRRGT
jgi:7-carboxy-7-deazaguanine synthase